MIKKLVIIVIICYLLLSTKLINKSIICKKKHYCMKNMLSWEINGLYRIFNPSITKCGKNYIMCCRYTNKTAKNILYYLLSNIKYTSTICFVILSEKMDILKVIFPSFGENIVPLEDPRIQFFENKYHVSVTEFKGSNDIFPCLYIFDNNFNLIKRTEYNRENYFIHTTPSNIQKNWCPFIHNSSFFLHTDTYPLWKVFDIGDDGSMKKIVEYNTNDFFHSTPEKIIRCSTSWKSFSENTYICGLHTKEFFLKIPPTIRSILVEIDKKTLLPIRKTDTFCIDCVDDHRIQFLSGLETDEYNVYLTFGVGDYKTEIFRFSKEHLNKNLLN